MPMDDFLSVAERGFFNPGKYAFLTGILKHQDVEAMVKRPLDDLNLSAQYDWGTSGLIVDFQDEDDLALFTLAYTGPCASADLC